MEKLCSGIDLLYLHVKIPGDKILGNVKTFSDDININCFGIIKKYHGEAKSRAAN